MDSLNWELVGTVIGVLSTLVAVPLTAIVFYLRAIREDQRLLQERLTRSVDKIEADCERVGSSVESVKRNYTTKEEWTRETMLARSQLGRLTELMARLQAELESTRGLATQFVRATNAIIEMTDRLGRRLSENPEGGADRDAGGRHTT